ncbi:MAG: saccharopine dehydrogenase NADP-binding domain-containing protein [Candidatus Doudnabacteria bacterium]|nr:saccharopine dehydrogenase NADP-binding domain-containing protein [Candidatus Doudnabacteria bacterium]
MKADFLVVGADGLQGQIVVKYFLKKGYKIFVSDIYSKNVRSVISRYGRGKGKARFVFCDLRSIPDTIDLIKKSQAPIVVNCADMYQNENVYRACLAAKRHCIDLGSWIELTSKQLGMDKQFKKIRRTAITGCGSVPGIGNVMLKYAARKFDTLPNVDVGFAWDSNIKKFVEPFSMKSVLVEFTGDNRYMRNGKYAIKGTFESSLRRKFRLIGKQRVFLVEHPEVYTFWRYFKHRGLKNVRFFAGFPEHSMDKIKALNEMGFNSDKPVKVENNLRIAPFDLLAPVLKQLKTPKGYTESENLWVKIYGKKNGRKKTILMECLVPPVRGWEDSGCNIDTGFPACVMAEMIRDGTISQPGSFCPEAEGLIPEMEFFRRIGKLGLPVYENGKEIKYA